MTDMCSIPYSILSLDKHYLTMCQKILFCYIFTEIERSPRGAIETTKRYLAGKIGNVSKASVKSSLIVLRRSNLISTHPVVRQVYGYGKPSTVGIHIELSQAFKKVQKEIFIHDL